MGLTDSLSLMAHVPWDTFSIGHLITEAAGIVPDFWAWGINGYVSPVIDTIGTNKRLNGLSLSTLYQFDPPVFCPAGFHVVTADRCCGSHAKRGESAAFDAGVD